MSEEQAGLELRAQIWEQQWSLSNHGVFLRHMTSELSLTLNAVLPEKINALPGTVIYFW
ncbi:hypothetical protein STEG23_029999, partial [Scotinomys teguina]